MAIPAQVAEIVGSGRVGAGVLGSGLVSNGVLGSGLVGSGIGAESISDEPTALYVLALTFASALLSGAGVLPFLAFGYNSIPKTFVGMCNAFAAGLVLSAVLSLLFEGVTHSVGYSLVGVVMGVAGMYFCENVLKGRFENYHLSGLEPGQSRRVFLIVVAISSHAIAEGLAMGLSFSGGHMLGLFITVAMALHNIPEGLAIALVLLSKGISVPATVVWVTVTHLPQPIFALVAFVCFEKDMSDTMLPMGLGFASGAMLYIVVMELIPEACQQTSTPKALMIIMSSLFVLSILHILFVPEI